MACNVVMLTPDYVKIKSTRSNVDRNNTVHRDLRTSKHTVFSDQWEGWPEGRRCTKEAKDMTKMEERTS